jgi:hypothetical protein
MRGPWKVSREEEANHCARGRREERGDVSTNKLSTRQRKNNEKSLFNSE